MATSDGVRPAYEKGLIYALDVECVATGPGHLARSVAQIAVVNQYEQVCVNLLVKPEQPIVSCITPLTGLTKELLDSQGMPLAAALQVLRQALPKNAVLVGQNINQDVQWLELRQESDFESMVDLAGLFRVWNPKYKSYSVFSQDYLCKALLGWDTSGAHDAALDALKSMRLFQIYQQYQQNSAAWQQAQDALLAGVPDPSFAKRNATFEGVCMGNRKTCKCGDPFFS